MFHILAKGGTEPICDFCSAPKAPWCYEAEDVVLLETGSIRGNSVGNWAACDTCKALIDKGDKTSLHLQMYESLLYKEPILTLMGDKDLAEIKACLARIVEIFFAHRLSSSNVAAA